MHFAASSKNLPNVSNAIGLKNIDEESWENTIESKPSTSRLVWLGARVSQWGPSQTRLIFIHSTKTHPIMLLCLGSSPHLSCHMPSGVSVELLNYGAVLYFLIGSWLVFSHCIYMLQFWSSLPAANFGVHWMSSSYHPPVEVKRTVLLYKLPVFSTLLFCLNLWICKTY